MQDRVKKYVSILMDEMTEGARLEYMAKSKRYKRLNVKSQKLYELVIASIPQDKQNLFVDYEECNNSQNALLEDYIYRRAFFQGIRLSGFFARLRSKGNRDILSRAVKAGIAYRIYS